MNMWAAVFCLALTTVTGEDQRYYKTSLTPQSVLDQQGEKTESTGFVEPLDFASFTQQFFTGSNNFQSLPFNARGDDGFDFFGAESKESKLLQPADGGGLLNFASSPFGEERQNSTGFVVAPRFISAFDGQASPSTFFTQSFKSTLPPPRPTEPLTEDYRELEDERPSPTPYRAPSKKTPNSGKSNYPAPHLGYKSDHSPTAAVYANSEDVEVFLPRDKLILPQKNGKPKPYDGYRAASDVESQVYSTQAYPRSKPAGRTHRPYPRPSPTIPYTLKDRRAQTFGNNQAEDFSETKTQEVRKEAEELEEDEDEDEVEEKEEYSQPKKPGFKYKYDTTITVPDLVIRTYPYEKPADNDREFTGDYETYTKSLPDDLERHYGTPDFITKPTQDYTVAATENLSKNANCERIEPKNKKADEAKTCYICHNPETGGSYEQCAYEEEPKSKKFYYGGATSSATQKESKPIKYRYRRSLDSLKFNAPSSYEYFIYNDAPNLNRKARAETKIYHAPAVPKTEPLKKKKKGTKKYTVSASKKSFKKRKPGKELIANPSENIEGPPASYEGPSYTYEGPSQPYEGPSGSYEGPSFGYEGPDHDNYYDKTDDRIPYKDNPPLLSTFFDDLGSKESQKRSRRGPKKEFEEFDFKDDFSSYRFGPEYFSDEDDIKPEPIKRNVFPKISSSINEEQFNNPETSSSNEEFFTGNVKIFKNGDVCEKKKKDNMVCMVCNNEKTGATYEQCQYSTKPSEQRYEFNRQKSFTSNKPDQGDRYQRHIRRDLSPDRSDKIEKKVLVTKVEKTVFGEGVDPDEPVTSESRGYRKIQRVLKSTDTSTAPSEEVESTAEGQEEEEESPSRSETETSEQVEARDGIEGLDEFLANSESKEDNFPKTGESYEDYFKRVFPEFESYEKITPQGFDPFSNLKTYKEEGTVDPADYVSYEESSSENKPTRLKDESATLPEQMFPTDTAAKQDIEDAYGAFQKKDWSKCKKIIHDKLVCHQCLDKNGVKNEECMYVDLGQPAQSHKAYHEQKDYDPAASSLSATAQKNGTSVVEAPPTKESTRKEGRQVVNETIQQVKFAKGDFEGVEKSTEKPKRIKKPIKLAKTDESELEKKKRQPVKKYQKEEKITPEASWESKKAKNVDDESVIKIYLNGTNS